MEVQRRRPDRVFDESMHHDLRIQNWKLDVDAQTHTKLGPCTFFYGVLILSILFGMALNFIKIKPMDAFFFTAVINGILAPFVLVGVLLVACDSVIMNRQTSSWVARVAVAITTIGMFFAAGAIFL